jgi:hypothetical protein
MKEDGDHHQYSKRMGAEEEEEEFAAAETYSQSSHEDEHDDNDDDESLAYEDEEDNTPQEAFWRQHILAIVVALLASVGSHFYSQQQQTLARSSVTENHSYSSSSKHAHLEQYVRTANISFCLSTPLPKMSGAKSGLKVMDFYIPQEQYQTLQVFYQADEAEDDLYEQTHYNDDSSLLQNPEFQCLLGQRRKDDPNRKFKGTTYYYKDPSMEEIYPEFLANNEITTTNTGGEMTRQRKLQQPPLVFTGFAAKFVNLSPVAVLLHWDGKGGNVDAKKLVGEIPPFESLGTATMPGHSFHVSPVYDSSEALQRWVVTADTALVYYEPYTPQHLQELLLHKNDEMLLAKYQRQLVNQAFARDYLIASHRTWFGHFPRRFPMHLMHPASYIGQTHSVGDFSLQVVSVTPRVMVIDNFLTPEE